MEQETFLSGYCRAMDQSRMVAAVTENGSLTEADCAFPDCPYAPSCPIAEKIQKLIK
ncbi:MAG: hypothetical protein IJW14_02680 [Oscillospiraceae bacterium]|nr:hypothetical protein [Oscillospiraceae bacterium]